MNKETAQVFELAREAGLSDDEASFLVDELKTFKLLVLKKTLEEREMMFKPVYAFRRKGLDDFCTCSKERFDELSEKPHLFDTVVFYEPTVVGDL